MKLTTILLHPIVTGLIGGLTIIGLVYIDSKCRKIERKKDTYSKLFIVSSLVFSIISYIISLYYTKKDTWLEQTYDSTKPNLQPKSKMVFKKKEIEPKKYVKKFKEFSKHDSNVSIEISKK